MSSLKRLNGVSHNIAHHAVSGLSYLHPHILVACRSAAADHMSIDLLDPEPCPERYREVQPLVLSLRALRTKLEDILSAEGSSFADLSLARLTFTPDLECPDDHCTVCRTELTSTTGRRYEHVVDYLGRARFA